MPDDAPFEVDDAIVLLLGAPTTVPQLDGRIEGVTRLEKLVFLFEKESDLKALLDEDVEFYAHNFGPFSKKVYQAVEVLEAAEMITDSAKVSRSNEDAWEAEELIGEQPDAPYTTRDFELTDRGRRYYAVLRDQFLTSESEKDLGAFKEKFGSIPLRQLIRYVYNKYDETTHNSLIRDQVLRG